jgi:hypothetical protein
MAAAKATRILTAVSCGAASTKSIVCKKQRLTLTASQAIRQLRNRQNLKFVINLKTAKTLGLTIPDVARPRRRGERIKRFSAATPEGLFMALSGDRYRPL